MIGMLSGISKWILELLGELSLQSASNDPEVSIEGMIMQLQIFFDPPTI